MKYTDEIAAEICARIGDGMSLRGLCREAGMPDRTTVYVWLRTCEDFRDRYALATDVRAQGICEEIQEIADDATGDYRLIEKDGVPCWVFDPERVQRDRLRIDARKWTLAKLAPKKYGVRVFQEHAGPDGSALRAVVFDPRLPVAADAQP